jgi:hypothetical protein
MMLPTRQRRRQELLDPSEEACAVNQTISNTHGAVKPPRRRPATKVRVLRGPCETFRDQSLMPRTAIMLGVMRLRVC